MPLGIYDSAAGFFGAAFSLYSTLSAMHGGCAKEVQPPPGHHLHAGSPEGNLLAFGSADVRCKRLAATWFTGKSGQRSIGCPAL